jgi:hypothetical protein
MKYELCYKLNVLPEFHLPRLIKQYIPGSCQAISQSAFSIYEGRASRH